MTKNLVQEARMRGYFLEAAKSIIKGEGIRTLNIRNVAEKAGYSFATLYNYYANLKDLVYNCLQDFMEECRESVISTTKTKVSGRERLIEKSVAFSNYFVQYPSIFALIFTDPTTEVANNEKVGEEILRLFDSIFAEDYSAIALAESKEVQLIADQHRFLLIGILSFYLLRREKVQYNEFISNLKKVLGE